MAGSRNIQILTGTTGLNTVLDPVRIRFDAKRGIQALSAAVNVDIDDSGALSRRKGFSVLRSDDADAFHSLYPTEAYCIAVTGDALCFLHHPNIERENMANVTPGAPMSYAPVGDRVYYANGHDKGYVDKDGAWAWVAANYVGPATDRTFNDPPVGHLIEYFNARMYVAAENLVYFSEPFAHHWFDLSENFLWLSSRITMLARTRGGLYISDETAIWFYGGRTPAEFDVSQVADYPAIEGTVCMANGDIVGDGSLMSGMVPVFTTTRGVCVGGPDGNFLNISKKRIRLPRARRGAALINDNQYITLLKE